MNPISVLVFGAGAIVYYIKAAVTRCAWREISGIWQRDYYEHILGGQSDYERVVGYIRDNPSIWTTNEGNPIDG